MGGILDRDTALASSPVFHTFGALHHSALFMLRVRKAAKSYFGENLSSDPAWNLLLALSTFDTGRKACHITSVAKRADVPRSTALRWLVKLHENGYVALTADHQDKRAVCVQLTHSGREAIQRSFVAERFAS